MKSFSKNATRRVFCIVPTHNRLCALKQTLNYLYQQTYPNLSIIVIDDASSDGTREFLEKSPFPGLIQYRGDGELWWGGAIELGMKAALKRSFDDDYLLLLNDDINIDDSYVEKMVDQCGNNKAVAIVSPQYDISTNKLSSIGYRLNYCKQEIEQVKDEPIDASIGRGLLIPVEIIRVIGLVNAKIFPHYMGDVEFTARIKDYNYDLLVAWSAPVYSDQSPSDSHVQELGEFVTRFHPRSKSNIFDSLKLFHRRGPLLCRIIALPRMIYRIGRLAISNAGRRIFNVL